MYPVWIAMFFGAVLMAYVAVDVPRKEAATARLAADVSATNLLAYRKAVQRYLAANPGASGTIADASLASYWMPGYIRDPNWTNLVSGGTLYVFSTTAATSQTLATLREKSPENLLVGRKNPATGNLQAFNGFDTGVALPAAIPNNAIVMMGI